MSQLSRSLREQLHTSKYYTHVDRDWCIDQRDKLGIRNFYETGTFKGDTSLWASEWFEHVYTVEIHMPLALAARRRFEQEGRTNITPYIGNTIDTLNEYPDDSPPTLFYLDAHWFEEGGGLKEQCPLLEELEILAIHPAAVTILIDDAPLILTPNDNYPGYPTLDQICMTLKDHDVSTHQHLIYCTRKP